MSVPTRTRPNAESATVVLTPHVEPIGPAAATTQTTAAADLPPRDDLRKRSFTVPEDLLARARTAQKTADLMGGEYPTLNDLVVEAIRRELNRLSKKYNSGNPFEPFQGEYRNPRTR